MKNPSVDQLIVRNNMLSRILELGKVMSTQKDLDSLLTTIITETSEILDADRTSLFLFDEVNHELWLKISEKQEINEIRFAADKGIAGHVAQTGKIMNITNAYGHEFFNPEIDQKTGYRTNSLLCAPMANLQGKLIGVIQVLNKNSGAFTEEDKEVLIMFSSLAAILLENSILAEEDIRKERLAMVGNMASSIIHDIKNPMTAIKGLAAVIALDSDNNQEHATVILQSVDRLLNMTEELLDFSKGIEKEVEFEEVNCKHFFLETSSFVQQELESMDISFDTIIDYDGNVEMNQDKIHRAIYNITGNARDAMPKGGKLTIHVSESPEKNHILVKIADTGKGIPHNIRASLFEPFVTYGKKNGTGLGMAITKKIITAHNGKINVSSEEGKGTEIELVLPKKQST